MRSFVLAFSLFGLQIRKYDSGERANRLKSSDREQQQYET